jgi:hypothetical protein
MKFYKMSMDEWEQAKMKVKPKKFTPKRKDNWVHRWFVNTHAGKQYTVAMREDGSFGCSCPAWKFRREECKHIQKINENLFLNLMTETIEVNE